MMDPEPRPSRAAGGSRQLASMIGPFHWSGSVQGLCPYDSRNDVRRIVTAVATGGHGSRHVDSRRFLARNVRVS